MGDRSISRGKRLGMDQNKPEVDDKAAITAAEAAKAIDEHTAPPTTTTAARPASVSRHALQRQRREFSEHEIIVASSQLAADPRPSDSSGPTEPARLHMGHMSHALPGQLQTRSYAHPEAVLYSQNAYGGRLPEAAHRFGYLPYQSGHPPSFYIEPQMSHSSAGYVGTGQPASFHMPFQPYSCPQAQLPQGVHHALTNHRPYIPRDLNASAYHPFEQLGVARARQYPLNTAHTFNPRHANPNSTRAGLQAGPTIQTTDPMGPPRKPRQSGHALWVGNLSPGATVVDLKDHFSRDATHDIESVKLIAKSNCAFVNYRTPAACAAALARFHDSHFHGTRLVCRLRRSSTSTPTTPISANDQLHTGDTLDVAATEGSADSVASGRDRGNVLEQCPQRFFILKSLTLQDLELSTRTGSWATQAHNESTLNDAFKNSDAVYLIFSANKSGEYFGFARMASQIPMTGIDISTGDKSSTNFAPNNITLPVGGPVSIPTPATEWAPTGRVIDDSARGTIFWEADIEDAWSKGDGGAANSASKETTDSNDSALEPAIAISPKPRERRAPTEALRSAEDADASSASSRSGHLFQVQWLSTKRVPFYRTRGLRNPWNANREIKIARDGTEIEPTIGTELLRLFDPSLLEPRSR